MFRPAAVYIGLRYLRARQRNRFISVISLVSIGGLAIGVTALVTVLSVMNGFEKELKSRILGMTAHVTLVDRDGDLADWRSAAASLPATVGIEGAAPFVRGQGMLTHRGAVQGAAVQGIDPALEPEVSFVLERLTQGTADGLRPGAFRVLLGAELARTLAARVGDKVTVIAPEPTTTAAGIVPRLRRFEVSGIFEIGMHEYDSGLAIVHLEDAARLFRVEGVTGVRLKIDDVYRAPQVRRTLTLPGSLAAIDWTQYHVNFFRALKTEKLVMFVILTLIVAVAAFNIVSTQVMVVADKRAEIAILRTVGMTPGGITAVFMVHGLLIGSLGTLLGTAGGIGLALNVEEIVGLIERAFGVSFLPADVYYISELPSDLRARDVAVTAGTAFVLAVTATLYPAWQAARTQPAEALRYE